MKLIAGILLGVLAAVWLLNAARMLSFNLSRFSEGRRLALPGYVRRLVAIQILNFGLVVLLTWASLSLLRGAILGRDVPPGSVVEQAEKVSTVKNDLSEYVTELTTAMERSNERIEELLDSPVVSDRKVANAHSDLLIELEAISPKTTEVLEVHRAYTQLVEDYAVAILDVGHMPASFKYAEQHQKVIDQLNSLCEKHGLKVTFR